MPSPPWRPEFILRDADARVLQPDLQHLAGSLDVEPDVSAYRRVLGGVAEQVRNYLDQPLAVGDDFDRPRRQVGFERVLAAVEIGAARIDRRFDDLGSADPVAAQFEHAARDARDVEQVVDQARHLRDLALDHFDRFLDFRIRQALQVEGGVAHRRERVAKLVREDRDELVLAAAGFLALQLGTFAVRDVAPDFRCADDATAGVAHRRDGQ
jgi:hypothetical protein